MTLQLTENLSVDATGHIVWNNSVKLDMSAVRLDGVVVIDALTEHRLHLVSKLQFGTENFADLLVVYNGITNPFYLPIGTLINIPNLESIEIALLTQIAAQQKHNSVAKQFATSLTAKNQPNTPNAIRSNGRLIFRKQS